MGLGDAGYRGIQKRDKHKNRKVQWFIAKRPFRVIKRMFGYNQVRYRGLAKNTNRLYVLVGLHNLLLRVKRVLLP
jgi:transposase, IS5 family